MMEREEISSREWIETKEPILYVLTKRYER